MRKEVFLDALAQKLSSISAQDRIEQLAFYREMIDDRIEEGASEEEAVAHIGSVEQIAQQILAEFPAGQIQEEAPRGKRKWRTWEIVLLAVGSPIWASLLLAVAAVAFSLIIAVFAVVFSLFAAFWAVVVSFAACVPAAVVLAVVHWGKGNGFVGVAALGVALFSAGVFLFSLLGSISATKGMVRLTAKTGKWLGRTIRRKEAQK